MIYIFKRLLLGFTLLSAASAFLLLSDTSHRATHSDRAQEAEQHRKWKILMAMLVDAAPMEEARQGMMTGLKQAGLEEGRDYELLVQSAQGDMPTMNNIMDSAASKEFDMILTITTPALQAAVNKIKNKPIVFCLAVDPRSWGGVKDDRNHPSNMTGIYVSNPFQKMVDVIRLCFPRTHKIGTLFSPAETNSVYVKDLFSKIVSKNNLQIVTMPVNSSVEVSEAADALIGKGIDVFCQIGDNTSSAAFPSIIQAAQKGHVPLFCFSTFDVRKGALVGVSNDHFDSGREAAFLVARIMHGENPGDIPLQPARTVKVAVNLNAAKKNSYKLPESLIQSANEVTGDKPKPKPLSKSWNIQLIEFANITDVEDSERGIRDGFKEAGLIEGRDLTLTVRNAQGDMVTLSAMVDTALSTGADLLMTMSTPTLQAAINRAKNRPIVFTFLANAIIAGAGKSNDDHLPNVTGVVTESAYEELISLLHQCMPNAKTLGTLFVPSEPNSVYNKDRTGEAAKKWGMELIPVPATTSSEVADAALALINKHPDAICQIAGNLTASAFPSLITPAQRAKIPVFAFQSNQAYDGASVVLARDFYDGGRESALLAARVMRGESPATIPIVPMQTTRLFVNKKAAALCGLKIPQSILVRADKIIE
jgi:ABC-type uncharacterized transport system substrate-binding protein